MIIKNFLLVILAATIFTQYVDSKPLGIEIFSACKYFDSRKLPVVAESCFRHSKKKFIVIGCDGEKCLTEEKPSSTKERCMRRKDPGPNVDPVGMIFFGPGTIEEPRDKAQCESKNSCASVRAEFQQMTYRLYKQTADYQKLYYKDKKSIAPTTLTMKDSKFFISMMKTESSSIPIQHPYNSGIDYLVFETSEDSDEVKNIFSVKEQVFVSAKDLKIKNCE